MIAAPTLEELDLMLKEANDSQGLLGTTRPPKVNDSRKGKIYLNWDELSEAMARQIISFDALEVERDYGDL